MANWFVSTSGWTAVTAWAASTAYSVGDIRRQLAAPTGTNHRVFRCTTAGTSGGAEPSWNLTKGATTTDNTVTWTEITGNSTYNATSFAAPHYWLQHAIGSSWAAAGDTVFVDTAHYETQSSTLTLSSAGTIASPVKVVCINSTFSNPPVSGDIDTTPGARIASTSVSNDAISMYGYAYFSGLTFESGGGASNHNPFKLGSSGNITYDSCTFKCLSTGAGGGYFWFGTALETRTVLYNCTIEFNSTGYRFALNSGVHKIIGGALTGSAIPTYVFDAQNGYGGSIVISGFDFNSSGTWTSKYLFNLSGLTTMRLDFLINNCLFAASLAAPATGAITSNNRFQYVRVVNSDDATSNKTYKEWVYQYPGVLTHETTVVRTNGSSDGTTSKAWAVVTNANSNYLNPFICPEIFTWVDSTGSKNFDIYIANTVADLDEADLWIELEYMGATTDPLSTIYTARPDILSAGATNWTDDVTSTWGSSPTYMQKCRITKTVNQKGWVRARVNVVKASSTIYIDPMINVS